MSCFRGGATRSLSLPIPLPACKSWHTDPEVVSLIDRLLNEYSTSEIAAQLNHAACGPAKVTGSHGSRWSTLPNLSAREPFPSPSGSGHAKRDEIAQQLGV